MMHTDSERFAKLDPFSGEMYFVDRVRIENVRVAHMRARFELVRHAELFVERYLSGTGAQSFAGNVRRVSSRVIEWDALIDTTYDRLASYAFGLQENAEAVAGRRADVEMLSAN